MDVEQLYKFIENPALLNDDSLQEIRKLVTQYPYFQTAHILYLKNLHNIDAGKYERQVKISGIQVNDRRRFYHLLFDEDFQEKHENEVEPKKETKEKENLKKKTKNDIGENISGVISQQIESSHEKKEIDDVIEYNTQSVVDPDSKKYKNEYDDKDSFSISEEEDGGSPVKEDENLKDEELSRRKDNDLLELDDENKGGKKNNLIDKFMKKEGESLKIKI